jgi:phosphatidylcholine synthase
MDPTKPFDSTTNPRAAAFAVHIFTALGAACALLALLAAVRTDWQAMFVWLGIALIIDGIDGTFARRLRVAELLPRWSGDALDLVVDILTYVFVPAYALINSGLLPPSFATALGAVIVVTGSLYFADREMKSSDYYFRGFPAVWNVAAFYLFVLKLSPWLNVLAILVLAVLSFAPFYVIHPMRIARMRTVTLVALAVWSLLAAFAVERNLDPAFWVTAILCLLGFYFLGVGFLRQTKTDV